MGISLLSAGFRGRGLALALLLLVGLSVSYAHHAMTAPLGWKTCLADPEAHHGRALRFPLYTVSGVDGAQQLRLSKVVQDIPVVVATSGIEVGDTVSLLGTFDATERVVLAERIEVHRLRPAKRALGILGLLYCAWMAPRRFRWRQGRLESRG